MRHSTCVFPLKDRTETAELQVRMVLGPLEVETAQHTIWDSEERVT